MPQFSGGRLRETRQSAGMTRAHLAVAASVSFTSVAEYEQGASVPSVDAAARMAAALGVKVDDLLETAAAAVPVGAAA